MSQEEQLLDQMDEGAMEDVLAQAFDIAARDKEGKRFGAITVISPAKVNLVLGVGPKREDGYHYVDTIMHALALHDVLEMYRVDLTGFGTGLEVHLTMEPTEGLPPVDVAPEDNLAYRAIKALAEAIGRDADEEVHVRIKKSIPAQAGLAGGSSNAAAALVGAAKLWGLDPADPRIEAVAAELGADVAFFLKGGCAYLTGKGEQFVHSLTPRKDFILLVRPHGPGVSTPEAYNVFDENPALPNDTQRGVWGVLQDAQRVELFNNLTEPAEKLLPELAEIRAWAESCEGVNDVLLCGSGSATALFCDSFSTAMTLSGKAKLKGWYARATSLVGIGAAIRES
jgi:4-diphosphocytidyl-2-C-methyl-D-erythritol kinase